MGAREALIPTIVPNFSAKLMILGNIGKNIVLPSFIHDVHYLPQTSHSGSMKCYSAKSWY